MHAHLRSLVIALVSRCTDIILPIVGKLEIPRFFIASVAEVASFTNRTVFSLSTEGKGSVFLGHLGLKINDSFEAVPVVYLTEEIIQETKQ